VKVKNDASDDTKKGEQIYTDLLQEFYTKNNLYPYIQSDRTRSYNFYGNYNIGDGPECLKLGITEAGMQPAAFATDGWPVLIDKTPQNQADATNRLYLQFVTDNNVNTMLYGQVARIDNAENNSFMSAGSLIQPDSEDGAINTFTGTIVISNKATGNDNSSINIASFNIFLYQGKEYSYVLGQQADDQNLQVDILGQINFFELFDSVSAMPILNYSPDNTYSAIALQKLKLINHNDSKKQYGISAVQTTIVNDVINTGVDNTPNIHRVTYETQAIEVLSVTLDRSEAVASNTTSLPSIFSHTGDNEHYRIPSPYSFTINKFTDESLTLNGLLLKTTNNAIANKIIIGVTGEENNLIKETLSGNTVANACLTFLNFDDDTDSYTSSENTTYFKYKIALLAEQATGNLGLLLTPTNVVIYTLDKQCFFSPDYSKYMVEESLGIKGDVDNEELNIV
jgi:hypothetical protein